MELTTRILLWSFQIAAFIAAVLMWRKAKNTKQKHFVYFLGFVLVIELLGYGIPQIFQIKSQFIYNCFTVISLLFYLFWFRKILVNKKIINLFVILFLIATCTAIFIEDFWLSLWRIPLITGIIMILICAIIFYYELLQSDKIINYRESQTFWIVTGLLIFYIGFLPLLLFQPYLKVSKISYRIPITILNIIMYGFFIKSFLCLKKK